MAKLLKVGDFDVLESESKLTLREGIAWAEKANEENACGFSDWVLPDKITLLAVAVIESAEKAESMLGQYSGFDSYDIFACQISLNNAKLKYFFKLGRGRIRLVRAEQMFEICRAGQIESMRQAGINEDKLCSL